MIAFYNEIDDYCCAWLSNLMDAGHITPGVISDASIEDLTPAELVGYDRVHLFAGIGVWDECAPIKNASPRFRTAKTKVPASVVSEDMETPSMLKRQKHL